MNRRKFITYTTLTSVIWLIGCTNHGKPAAPVSTTSSGHEDAQGYWTCTMHPQVHLHEPGKCPICGMPLVHVDKNPHTEKLQWESSQSTSVQASDAQLSNAQISKYTVKKKDLEISIPVSGRVSSSRQVVFQIYESDLPTVKAGASFFGSPSAFSGQRFKGKITRVDNLVDPSSRTVRVEGQLDVGVPSNASESAFPGEITQTLKNQIVIPENAVLHAGTRDLVYVFTPDNKLSAREVVLGQKGQNQYQILSGLQEGEVISSGANFLIDSEAKLRGQ